MQPELWVLAVFLLLQLLVYLFLFRKLAAIKVRIKESNYTPGVSVIIAAKNEEQNLLDNLPAILKQDYPSFEVIVVDDQSEDDTPHILEGFEKQYANLTVVTIEEHIKDYVGKKLALTLGIKAAKHEIILLTDADCAPGSDRWIREMVSSYENPETEIVLGYSPYRVKPGLLNLIIRFDTFYTALQYFSFALAGKAYMGVGRNLSYRKEFFFRNKGFAPYLKVFSGDDDLFVNCNATTGNVGVELSPDSFTWTEPKKDWGTWFSQKRRHQHAGKYYKAGDKRKLWLLWLSNVLFYGAFILGLIFIRPVWIPLSAYGLRFLVQMIIFYLVMKKLRCINLLPFAPVLEIIYQFFLLPLISLFSLRKPKKPRW